MLVLSESSIDSDWVERELDQARAKEKKEKRDVLLPLSLDGAWKPKVLSDEAEPLWRQVKKKHVLDFSNWRDSDAFEAEFRKLLKGMKVNYTRKDS